MLESVSLILELGINQDRFSVFHLFQSVSVFIHLKNLAQPFAMKATQDAGFATTANEAGGTGKAGNDGQEKRDCREQHEKGVQGSKWKALDSDSSPYYGILLS